MDLIESNSLKACDIKKITVGMSKPAMRELVTPYPENGEEAKFSIGFQIGLYLNGIENMPENYTKDIIYKPEVQDIIQKTSMYNKTDYDDLPSDMGVGPALVTIETTDGRTISKEQIYPVGHLTNPMSDRQIYEKYLKCSESIIGKENADALYDLLFALENVENMQIVTKLTY